MKYIIFDMDGVLINTEPLHFEVWREVLSEYGFSIDFNHYKGCIGSTLSYLFEIINREYGVLFSDQSGALRRFHEVNYRKMKAEGIPRMTGAIETLTELKRRGFRMAVASSSPQDVIEYCMETVGLLNCFDFLFSGERVARPKPFPDIFLEVASRLNANSSDCVVVEDSQNGSRAAKAAGMYCIGLKNPDSGDQDLSAADRIIRRLPELLDILP